MCKEGKTCGCCAKILAAIDRLARAQNASELLCNVAETAAILNISGKNIRNGISAGTFPIRSVKLGRRRLFKRSDILAYLKELPYE